MQPAFSQLFVYSYVSTNAQMALEISAVSKTKLEKNAFLLQESNQTSTGDILDTIKAQAMLLELTMRIPLAMS